MRADSRGLSGGVGAAGFAWRAGDEVKEGVGGICGSERPGPGLVGDGDCSPTAGLGPPPRAGNNGLGLPGGKAKLVGNADCSSVVLLLLPPLSTTAVVFTGLN